MLVGSWIMGDCFSYSKIGKHVVHAILLYLVFFLYFARTISCRIWESDGNLCDKISPRQLEKKKVWLWRDNTRQCELWLKHIAICFSTMPTIFIQIDELHEIQRSSWLERKRENILYWLCYYLLHVCTGRVLYIQNLNH